MGGQVKMAGYRDRSTGSSPSRCMLAECSIEPRSLADLLVMQDSYTGIRIHEVRLADTELIDRRRHTRNIIACLLHCGRLHRHLHSTHPFHFRRVVLLRLPVNACRDRQRKKLVSYNLLRIPRRRPQANSSRRGSESSDIGQWYTTSRIVWHTLCGAMTWIGVEMVWNSDRNFAARGLNV